MAMMDQMAQTPLIPPRLSPMDQMAIPPPRLSPMDQMAIPQFTGPLSPALIEEEFTAIQIIIQRFLDWLEEAFAPAWEGVAAVVDAAIRTMGESLGLWGEDWARQGDAITTVLGVIISTVALAFQLIVASISGAVVLITGVWQTGLALLRGDWEGAWQAIVDTVDRFLRIALSFTEVTLDAFKETWRNNLALATIIINDFLNKLSVSWSETLEKIARALEIILKGIVSTIKGNFSAFFDAGQEPDKRLRGRYKECDLWAC